MPGTSNIPDRRPRIPFSFEVTLDVRGWAVLEKEYDDDGCGSPSKSGNSMTGCRGSHFAVVDIELADQGLFEKQISEAVLDQNQDHLDSLAHDYQEG